LDIEFAAISEDTRVIASLRGIVVLAIVAAILAVFVVVFGPARPAVIDRSIWSGGEPTELTITHVGEPPIVLVKRGTEWRWREPDIRADAATVDGILTALRAKWHRSGTANGKRHGSLRIGATTIEIGEPLAGTEQTWIIRDGRAFLVDNWVARALVPPRLALRVRRPFANIAGAHVIEVPGVARLEGTHRTAPTSLWLDPAVVQRFDEAAEAIEIVALGGTPDAPGLRIVVDGREVSRVGNCNGGRVLIKTPDGDGCVDAAAWRALETAAHALDAPDKRPIPFTPSKITFGDGSILDVKSHDLDRDRERELLTALQTPGELAPRSGTPTGTLDADGVTLELYKDGVAREGEPVMIRTPLIDIIRRPSAAYRDTTRWREDAMTIQSITIDGKTFTRGAVIGEWTGATQPGLVEALAGTLATVRAPAADKAPAAKHHIAVTFAPPTGSPTTHTIEIGERCMGRIDGAPAVVPADLCTAASTLQ
jgi:hypothetical protein